jgi:hypothetical protein
LRVLGPAGLDTITGMLIGARLEQAWHHARAHRFFSGARWSADQLGLVLLDLILAVLVPSGVPVRLVAATPSCAAAAARSSGLAGTPRGAQCVSRLLQVVCWQLGPRR